MLLGDLGSRRGLSLLIDKSRSLVNAPLSRKVITWRELAQKSALIGSQKRFRLKNGWLFLGWFFAIVYCSVDPQKDSYSDSQQTFASREKLPFCEPRAGSRSGYFMQLLLHPNKRGRRAHGKFFSHALLGFEPARRLCELRA
jgi:hypothetical protein